MLKNTQHYLHLGLIQFKPSFTCTYPLWGLWAEDGVEAIKLNLEGSGRDVLPGHLDVEVFDVPWVMREYHAVWREMCTSNWMS